MQMLRGDHHPHTAGAKHFLNPVFVGNDVARVYVELTVWHPPNIFGPLHPSLKLPRADRADIVVWSPTLELTLAPTAQAS